MWNNRSLSVIYEHEGHWDKENKKYAHSNGAHHSSLFNSILKTTGVTASNHTFITQSSEYQSFYYHCGK